MPSANQKYTYGETRTRKIERAKRTKPHNHFPQGKTGYVPQTTNHNVKVN